MALTDRETEFLERLLQECEENASRLSPWERGFMDDQRKRFEEHGAAMSLSPKQWNIIKRVTEKLEVESW